MKGAWLSLVTAAVLCGQGVPDVIRHGEEVFAKTCSTGYCHGAKGSPGGAPRLAGRGFDQAFIAGTVARGVPNTGMPSFATTLSRADLVAVVAYVATLNGISNPVIAAGPPEGSAPQGPALSPEAARGRELFSDAVRGFGRCSTCHELNGIGIPVATPISEIPANAAALRALASPHVSTATMGGESMPALMVSKTNRKAIFYDLTTAPPVLRNADASVAFADGNAWKHSSAIISYSDSELTAVIEYLRAVVKP